MNFRRATPKWEFSHISLQTKNLFQLRLHFAELLRTDSLIDWHATCVKVLQTRHAPLCQQVLKKGATPNQLRGALWSYVLGSHIEPHVSKKSEKSLQNSLTVCFF